MPYSNGIYVLTTVREGVIEPKKKKSWSFRMLGQILLAVSCGERILAGCTQYPEVGAIWIRLVMCG